MANASGNAYALGGGTLGSSAGSWVTTGRNPSWNITPSWNDSLIDDIISDDAEEEFKETIDWIEVMIDRIERKIKDLDTLMSSSFRSFTKRAESLGEEYAQVTREIDIQRKAYEKYMERFNSMNLSAEYKDKILNGKLQIEDITDESLKDLIDETQEWAEKALDCKYAITDLNEQLAELVKTNFDNIISEFDHLLNRITFVTDATEKALDIVEAKGQLASNTYFEDLMATEQENLAMLTKEYETLQTAFEEAMKTNTIEEGSDAW